MMILLSACGITRTDTVKPPSAQQEKNTSSSTEGKEEAFDPFFLPLYTEFRMGKLSDTKIRFPVVVNKVKNINVKVYKISEEHFIDLLNQHPGWAKHEGKLNISKFSAKEKIPFFEGNLPIEESTPVTKIPRESTLSDSGKGQMNGYITIPTVQADYTAIYEGYFYFEFDSPEMLKYTGDGNLNSLLEITHTKQGVSFDEQYIEREF